MTATSPPLATEPLKDQVQDRSTLQSSIRFHDTEGNPVEAHVVGIEFTEALENRLHEGYRMGRSLWGDSVRLEGATDAGTGVFHFASDSKVDFFMAFSDGHAPAVFEWRRGMRREGMAFELHPVDPISVTVLDANGEGIEGAEVWIRPYEMPDMDPTSPPIAFLEAFFFQEVHATGADGRATLPRCLIGVSNEAFVIPGESFAAEIVDSLAPGHSVTVRAEPGCILSGNVAFPPGSRRPVTVRIGAVLEGKWFGVGGTSVREDGSYSIQNISADFPALAVACVGPGYASQKDFIVRPEAGRHYSMDFELDPGVGGELTLLTGWGEPICSATLKLLQGPGDTLPFDFQTATDGRVTIPEILPVDRPVSMRIDFAAGWSLFADEPLRGGKDQNLEVPGLARVAHINLPQELRGESKFAWVYWLPEGLQLQGYPAWQLDEAPSPIIPAGYGVRSIEFDDGRAFEIRTTIPSVPDALIDFSVELTSLKFQIPHDRPSQVSLYTATGTPVYWKEAVTGTVEVPCQVGSYQLTISSKHGVRRYPGLELPPEGLDLGLLEGRDTASIGGKVLDQRGLPLPSVHVILADSALYDYWETYSGQDGAFLFEDLPAGLYYLRIQSEESYGSKGLLSQQEVSVRPGEALGPLEVTLQGAQAVEGTFSPGGLPSPRAFVVDSSGLVSAGVNPDGHFSLPAPQVPGWLGVCSSRLGESWLVGTWIPAGPGSHHFGSDWVDLTIQVEDELGIPWTGLVTRLELDGLAIPARVSLDGDGRLLLHAHPGLPLVLSCRRPGGTEARWVLDPTVGAVTLKLARQEPSRSFSVVGEGGKVLTGAVIQSKDGRQTLRPGGFGLFKIPADWERGAVASAEGFFGREVPSDSGRIQLPEALSNIRIQVTGVEVESLAWTSLNAILAEGEASGHAKPQGNGVWVLPHVPQGGIRLTLCATNGEKTEKIMEPQSSEERLVWQASD